MSTRGTTRNAMFQSTRPCEGATVASLTVDSSASCRHDSADLVLESLLRNRSVARETAKPWQDNGLRSARTSVADRDHFTFAIKR